ncbi:hypothetical protein LCGC14_0413860 [marine sediment metagenome]|uniref:Bacteriophage T4 Gp32 single-stranded DNA-binding domain-containing protein n=1 Tax=marine sediment metagenome TaxID=412755 RepID=A0A0F9SSY5_9ZZZZ
MPRAKSNAKPKRQSTKKKQSVRQSAGGIHLDSDDLRQDMRDAGGGNYFTWPDSGKVKLRLLPYERNGRAKLFYKAVQHWQPTPEIRGSVSCGGHDCKLCQLRASLDKANQDLIDHLRPRIQYLFNVVDKADKEERIQIFRGPKTVYDRFVAVILDEEEFPDACSLENGVDFLVQKSGTGLNTTYGVTPSPKRSAVSPQGSLTNFEEQEANRGSVDLKVIAEQVAEAYDVTVPF